MPAQLKLKKSSVVGKVPTTADLEYGELAINYADGVIYFKKSNNTVGSFIAGTGNYVTSFAGLTGDVTAQQLLTVITSIDGTNSGINADYLDGYTSADFLLSANAAVQFAGTISHSGLVPTTGTNIDQVKVFTKALNLTGGWQDVGISGTDLSTGTYIIQLYANDIGNGGNNIDEYYTGTMSWYNGLAFTAQELPTDEIVLHRAGAGEDGGLYLRTFRSNQATLKLQLYSNTENPSQSNYVFKFRRMI